jgi:alkylation response protein AidB-like acyl-CoA dehydrogenase
MSEFTPLIRRDEIDFLLFDWLGCGRDGSRDIIEATLDVATQLAKDVFLPCNAKSDVEEPVLKDGGVRVLPEIAAALRQYTELGLFSASFDESLGGLGFSRLVCSALYAQFAAANSSAAGFPMLSNANARVIASFGTQEQIDRFARPGIEGRWYGTMCLSEPQAGSSLGDIRTRAVQECEDELGPRFRLTGNKMWISGGDQDIAENIVHLVLAKEPGPDGALIEGTAGISLFIVPKILPDGTRNDVSIAGLNHKMGYRGLPNCMVNFGENGGAIGWRLGEPGSGLKYMFQMMNEARIAVGTGAAALAYRGYMHALRYAGERLQGRYIGVRSGRPVPIIEHADVRAMLLRQKVYAEGSLALCFYCADLSDAHDDPDSQELLGLLTPAAKSWPSEFGLIANDLAIQVHGGYGYTRGFDVERLWRDNRLNPIHEGTTGIQAQDLLGRKLLRSDGRGLQLLRARVEETARRAGSNAALAEHGAELHRFFDEIDATLAVLARVEPARAFDNATWFLRAFGHGVVAWLWLDIALLSASGDENDFHRGKLKACGYFFESELPQARAWLQIVSTPSPAHAEILPSEF